MSYGQDAKIGISFQNSFGTANVASMHWLEPISESVDLKKAENMMKGINGAIDENASIEGLNTIAGDVVIEAKANALGVILAANNASPTTVTSGTIYTHTFKPRQGDHSVLSAERPFTYLKNLSDGGSAHQYANLNAASMELSIANGELMTAKMSVVGGDYSRVGSMASVFSASNPIDWSVSSVSVSAVAVTNIRSLTISQDNKLSSKAFLDGSKTPGRIKRTDRRSISVSGTITFDDQTYLNMFLAQSEQRMTINLRGNSLVSSGYYEALAIDIPNLRFLEFPIVVGGAAELEVSFKAKAKYNIGSGTAIAYTLTCGKAGF